MRRFFLLFLLSLCLGAARGGDFTVGTGTFLLNGQPFVVRAAELHYPRIPAPYWEHRIAMCKALGMNTVCLYVFWNAHEPQPGQFCFDGQLDLAAFCRLCQKHGLYVILRPGPYVCAEWEMGGLPWWLLKKKDVRLREPDPYFMERVAKFEDAVAEQVSGLTIQNGGPIIMVQVENEYGSYGEDKAYVGQIRDMLRRHYPHTALFQCDWASNFTKNGLPDLTWTMNFGTGANIDDQFRRLRQLRPESPLMCSEFWSGWFDKWGAHHETRPAADMIAGIGEMLGKGISFSLYMTHGGTNFGHWAGANSPGFAPDVTSYDYDAPISEQGRATPKYWLLRDTLARYAGGRLPKVPAPVPVMAIAPFSLTEVAPLWSNIPAPAPRTVEAPTMEALDQGFGSALYRTTLPALPRGAVLTVEAHDYAQVFVDGNKTGTLDRRNGDRTLRLPACQAGARLDILVEAMGRINFGRAIKDFKGLVGGATVSEERDGHTFVCDLKGWDVSPLPDDTAFYAALRYEPVGAALPAGCYRGTFSVKRTADTYLDMSAWGKGLVYVNGHGLGRFWSMGPQQTLYVPGCWLRKGQNDIVVFDITGPRAARCQGLAAPLLDSLAHPRPLTHRLPGQRLDLTGATPALETEFAQGNGWQTVRLPKPQTGRYVCIECLDAHDGKDRAAIAELYLIDERGERISREPWTVKYADSEDVAKNNCSADKLFDLQESTYWQTRQGEKFAHSVVIDLGATRTITAIEQLPRMESHAPGAVRRCRVYVSDREFKY